MLRLLLGQDRIACPQVHLRERSDCLRRLGVVPDLEGDAERVLQDRDRPLGMPEKEVEAAEVVQEPADVRAVSELLVVRLRALSVRSRQNPVALTIGDERRLEREVGHRARVL